jgi:hypothetical protein
MNCSVDGHEQEGMKGEVLSASCTSEAPSSSWARNPSSDQIVVSKVDDLLGPRVGAAHAVGVTSSRR